KPQDSQDYTIDDSLTCVIYAIGSSDVIAYHGGNNRGNFGNVNFFTGSS
ncbi:unnamed protein product, partial [Allacma fusca]